MNGEKLSIKDYLLSEKKTFSLIGFLKKYTVNLISKKEIENNINTDEYSFISPQDYKLINHFKGKFLIELNEKEGYIKVIAHDKDPFISTQLVSHITKSLQQNIIELRTNKIKRRLKYSKDQYDLKQQEYDMKLNELAAFKDSNKNINTATFRSELLKLESEVQLQQNILFNLASEYNNNKIKLNKDTPIFSVLDEVSVPVSPSYPNRILTLIITISIGLILSIGYILMKDSLGQFFNDIDKKG